MTVLTLLLFSLLSSPAQSTEALCDVAVHAEGVDFEEFESAAQLRLPGIRFRRASTENDPECVGRAHGFVEIRPEGPGQWELRLIVSDGRAWYRPVEAPPEQVVRLLATTLANVMMAVENASIEPDARGVPLPDILVETEGQPTSREVGEQPSEPTPSLPDIDVELIEEGAQDEGVNADAPAEAESVKPRDTGEGPKGETEPPVAATLLEIGPRIGGLVVFGVTPSGGLRGGGGGIALDLRTPKGLTVTLGVRELVSRSSAITLLRTRAELGAGWTARAGMFEVPVTLAAAIEPWTVRWSGPPPARPPLVGGGLRAAPGLRLAAGPVQLRIALGLSLELSVEASQANGLSIPALAPQADLSPVLRAGGVELGAGLELGVWIPVRERSGQ